MATKTAAQAAPAVQPRGNHTSVDAVQCRINFADAGLQTSSAADVILVGKIPNGSTLLMVDRGDHTVNADNVFPLTWHIDGVTLGSATAHTVGFISDNALPHTVSLSDDAVPQHTYLKATVGAITSATNAGSLSVTMFLTRDA
jgi:hypothetical protein